MTKPIPIVWVWVFIGYGYGYHAGTHGLTCATPYMCAECHFLDMEEKIGMVHHLMRESDIPFPSQFPLTLCQYKELGTQAD